MEHVYLFMHLRVTESKTKTWKSDLASAIMQTLRYLVVVKRE